MSEVKLQVTAAVPPLSTDGMEHVMAACEGTKEQVTDRVIDWLIDKLTSLCQQAHPGLHVAGLILTNRLLRHN